MEPRQSLCILPSNAPLHNQESGSLPHSIPRRVLQDTSGNVQNSVLEASQIGHAKLATNVANIRGKRVSPVNAQPTIASRLELKRRERMRIRAGSQLPLITRKQIASPEYQQYRARQCQNGGEDGEPKWPDDVEEAFLEALLLEIAPIGRRKVSQHGKPCGRNELISDHIKRRTGVHRSRKQVSSHIQVLKQFFKKDPEFMDRVTAKDSTSNPFATREDLLRCLASSQHGPSAHAPQRKSHENPLSTDIDFLSPLYGDVAPSLPSFAQNSVHDLDFGMWVQPRDQDKSVGRAIHVYSALQAGSRLSPAPLKNLRHWQSRFPQVESLHRQGALDCEIILLEASIDPLTDYPMCDLLFGTNLELKIGNGSNYDDWECVTNLYSTSQPTENRSKPRVSLNVDSTATVTLSFLTDFWVGLFTGIATNWRAHKDHGDGESLRHEVEKARAFVRSMTAVQELYASSKNGWASQQRVALLLWKFRLASPGEAGITTWRNVIPPPRSMLTTSPILIAPQMASASSQRTLSDDSNYPSTDATDNLNPPNFDLLGIHSLPLSRAPQLADHSVSQSIDMAHDGCAGDFSGGPINLYYEPPTIPNYDQEPQYFSPATESQPYEVTQWSGYNHLFSDTGLQHQSFGEGEVDRSNEPEHDHALSYQ